MRIVKELALWALLAALVALGAAGIVPISAKAQSQGQAVTIVNGGFDKSGRSTDISATTSSSSVALPTTAGETILVMNVGSNTVFVQLGSSTVAATTTAGLPIFSNSSITLARGGNTHIAAITASSTSTVSVLRGAGVPAMVGGGSAGGGGGGGAVTIIDGGDVAEGTTTDAACAGDATSGCTLLARIGRTNARLSTIISTGIPVTNANANGQATMANSSPVVIAGDQIVADPCTFTAKLNFTISQTAGAQIITGTSAKKTYICSLTFIGADAEGVSIIAGTGTVCATGSSTVFGGTTGALGPNFAANGGMTFGNGAGTVLAALNANADNVCLLQSASGRVAGGGTYVQR